MSTIQPALSNPTSWIPSKNSAFSVYQSQLTGKKRKSEFANIRSEAAPSLVTKEIQQLRPFGNAVSAIDTAFRPLIFTNLSPKIETLYLDNEDDTYTIYKGAQVADKPHGYGIAIVKQERSQYQISIYEGEFRRGLMHGKGTYQTDKFRYTGDFEDDHFKGLGYLTFADGTIYGGQFAKDELNGKGIYHDSDGFKYVGEYVDGARQGWGIETDAEGTVYAGEYLNDEHHGKGLLVIKKELFFGDFQNGLMHGRGVWTDKKFCFSGNFIEGHLTSGDCCFYQAESFRDILKSHGQLTPSQEKILDELLRADENQTVP